MVAFMDISSNSSVFKSKGDCVSVKMPVLYLILSGSVSRIWFTESITTTDRYNYMQKLHSNETLAPNNSLNAHREIQHAQSILLVSVIASAQDNDRIVESQRLPNTLSIAKLYLK